MPVIFSVDPEAITDSANDLSQIVEMHRRVLLDWRDLGLLVHPGAKLSESPILKAIEQLPVAVKKLWFMALRYNKRRACTAPWSGTFEEDTCASLHREWELALLQSARATLIADLEDDQISKCIPALGGMEICRFHGFGQSKKMTESRSAMTSSLQAGANCRDEWARRYGSWVRACDTASLVDRYALKDHVHCEKIGKKSGLWLALHSFFLRKREMPVGLEIILGDQDIGFSEIEDFSERLERDLALGGIRSLKLIIAPDSAFRDHCHHRYMRCDYAVFGFDLGFSAFSGDQIGKDCVVWKKDRAEDPIFDGSEKHLIQSCSTKKVIFS